MQKQKIILVLSIIVIIAILGIGGCFLYQKYFVSTSSWQPISQIDASKDFSYELLTPKSGGADMKVDVSGNETAGGYIVVEGQALYYRCNKFNFDYEKSSNEIKIFREINVKDCNDQGLFPYAYKARVNDIAPGTYKVSLVERVRDRDGSSFDVEHIWQNSIVVK